MLKTVTLTLVMALATGGAMAKDNKAPGKGHGAVLQHTGAGSFCPPGLAKKNNGCMPPGQARKQAGHSHDWEDRADWSDHDWDDHDHVIIHVGDYVDHRYVRIDDPARYGLNPDYFYYRALDRIVRVDPDTRRVLGVIGLIDALLN